MTKKKSVIRGAFSKVLGVILALAVVGIILFSAFREQIEQWEYPEIVNDGSLFQLENQIKAFLRSLRKEDYD